MVEDFDENYITGWVKIYRSVRNHWIWNDPVKFQWWIDILLEVNHTPKQVAIGYKLFDCGRGECLMSLKNWSIRWNVSKTVVNNFLRLLERDKMITIKNETVTTRITICNYESYQQKQNGNKTQQKRKKTQQSTTKELKNEKNENNINIPFDKFWDLYDKKVGDKTACEKKWSKLKDEERDKIISSLPEWKKQYSEKQYQPYPATYLNQKRWNDEIIKSKQTYSIKDL